MSDFDSKAWIAQLKPGDTVIVSRWPNYRRVESVVRLTGTQVVVGRDERFRIKDGYAVGFSGRYDQSSLERATPELLDRIRSSNLRERIKDAPLDHLTLDQLRQVWAIIKPKEKPTNV